MSKRAEQKALEAYPAIKIDREGEVICGGFDNHTRKIYIEAYEQAEKDFAELLKERIKTWESIYDENEQFGIDNEQANAVLGELKSLLEDYEKDNTI